MKLSSEDAFSSIQMELDGLGVEELKSPNMPVDVFVQEAENLFVWCKDDQAELTACGLDWQYVEKLPLYCAALRQAEAQWYEERHGRTEAQNIWRERSHAAFQLYKELLHAFHFAFRKDSVLLGRLREVGRGRGNAVMIQGLNNLAVLGKAHRGLLRDIGFEPDKLTLAADMSAEMARLLSQATGDRSSSLVIRVLRDKIYTLAKQAVDEIRVCGRYVFGKNSERAHGYASPYARRYNSRRKEAKK